MSYNQVNTTVVHDGVTLYQRNDHKVARWYYRLKFPGTSKHYIKSSGTIDFEKAKTAAITQFYMLLGKIDANVFFEGLQLCRRRIHQTRRIPRWA